MGSCDELARGNGVGGGDGEVSWGERAKSDKGRLRGNKGAHQKPFMPASTARPSFVRQPAERPPGLGEASTSVTRYPCSLRCCMPGPEEQESLGTPARSALRTRAAEKTHAKDRSRGCLAPPSPWQLRNRPSQRRRQPRAGHYSPREKPGRSPQQSCPFLRPWTSAWSLAAFDPLSRRL